MQSIHVAVKHTTQCQHSQKVYFWHIEAISLKMKTKKQHSLQRMAIHSRCRILGMNFVISLNFSHALKKVCTDLQYRPMKISTMQLLCSMVDYFTHTAQHGEISRIAPQTESSMTHEQQKR